MEVVKKIDVSKEEMASYVINAVGDEFKQDPVFEDDFNYELLDKYNLSSLKEVRKLMSFYGDDLRRHNFKSNDEIYCVNGKFNLRELTELENYLVYLKFTQELKENKEQFGYVDFKLDYNYDGEKSKYKIYLHK